MYLSYIIAQSDKRIIINIQKIKFLQTWLSSSSDSEIKDKNGYYIAINFEKFTSPTKRPQILKIRFGYLEHVDWIAQKAATGQQARLSPVADKHKLITIYPSKNLDEISSQDTDS